MKTVITEEGFIYKYDGEYFYDEINNEKFKSNVPFIEIDYSDYEKVISVYLNKSASIKEIQAANDILSKYTF